jgi:hypothetical protein
MPYLESSFRRLCCFTHKNIQELLLENSHLKDEAALNQSRAASFEFLTPLILTVRGCYWFFFTRARWFAALARACASISA